jgi:hypothetical protein
VVQCVAVWCSVLQCFKKDNWCKTPKRLLLHTLHPTTHTR